MFTYSFVFSYVCFFNLITFCLHVCFLFPFFAVCYFSVCMCIFFCFLCFFSFNYLFVLGKFLQLFPCFLVWIFVCFYFSICVRYLFVFLSILLFDCFVCLFECFCLFVFVFGFIFVCLPNCFIVKIDLSYLLFAGKNLLFCLPDSMFACHRDLSVAQKQNKTNKKLDNNTVKI